MLNTMKPITNEIDFFGTSQKEMMNSFANKLITIYNEMGGGLPKYESGSMKTWYGYEKSGLMALIDKVSCLIFDRGDPMSVPVFLKRVAKGKIKMQSQPAQPYDHVKEDYQLGLGHFRCYGKAYTLTPTELEALRQYITGEKQKVSVIPSNGFNFQGLSISAKLKASGVHAWGDKDMLHNKFWITVANVATGEVVGFDFFGSYHDYLNKVTELEGKEVLGAFDCFISDALAANNGFEDFCSELGYDSDSRSAERIYKECEKTLEKAKEVIDGDLYEFANALREVIEIH